MNTSDQPLSGEVHSLPQVQDQETQMMQNLFQRAADTIVNASKLGKEVNELRAEMQKLLADTDRMREHITWLEQENQTLREQRDTAQNTLSNTTRNLDGAIKQYNNLEFINTSLTTKLESARQDATTWENLANETEKSLREANLKVFNLQNMLESVWGNIKDHFMFSEPKAPIPQGQPVLESVESAPRVEPQTPQTEPKSDEYVKVTSGQQTINPDGRDYWNNPNQHPAE